jgi:Domain of unknown function (DUF4062)
MRIFVSSSFEDLREYREAAIRVLRQLGHEVLVMEDMVAGTAAPLVKVIEMVDRSEAFVGLFAWRYGYIPGRLDADGTTTIADPPIGLDVSGAVYGETSVTHYEYLRAKERDLPILAFLLHESVPLTPIHIDGFDRTRIGAPTDASRIRDLRSELQTEKVISWFNSPSDLEARVAAAITMVGLSQQIDVQQAASIGVGAGDQSVLDSAGYSISQAIAAVGDRQRVIKIDLADTWWSTRLFLVAVLANRLTQVRRIVVVRRLLQPPPTNSGVWNDTPPVAFVGQIGTAAIVSTIGAMSPVYGRFLEWMRHQPDGTNDDVFATSQTYLHKGWAGAFTNTLAAPKGRPTRTAAANAHEAERGAKVDVTASLLRRWFGDAMLSQPVEIADLKRASIVDLMRLLDYPNDFVPVLSARLPDADEPTGRIEVIDRSVLTSRLAHSYLTELKERARSK